MICGHDHPGAPVARIVTSAARGRRPRLSTAAQLSSAWPSRVAALHPSPSRLIKLSTDCPA